MVDKREPKTMERKELGIAVVGSGRMGSQRAGLAAAHPAVGFLAVSDIDPSRAQALAEKTGAQFASGDNLEVISRPEVNAVIVSTSETDYRYSNHGPDGTQLSEFELSSELGRRCRGLAWDLGLAFAGIDLRLSPDGTATCFEVNPSPAFSYYEAHTGQPIADAVARYLSG